MDYMVGQTLFEKMFAEKYEKKENNGRRLTNLSQNKDVLSGLESNPELKKLDNIRFIISGLLSAASILHKEGIIHRDIKPSNIFVPFEGSSLKLGDFGSCGFKYSKDYIGTLDYAAP